MRRLVSQLQLFLAVSPLPGRLVTRLFVSPLEITWKPLLCTSGCQARILWFVSCLTNLQLHFLPTLQVLRSTQANQPTNQAMPKAKRVRKVKEIKRVKEGKEPAKGKKKQAEEVKVKELSIDDRYLHLRNCPKEGCEDCHEARVIVLKHETETRRERNLAKIKQRNENPGKVGFDSEAESLACYAVLNQSWNPLELKAGETVKDHYPLDKAIDNSRTYYLNCDCAGFCDNCSLVTAEWKRLQTAPVELPENIHRYDVISVLEDSQESRDKLGYYATNPLFLNSRCGGKCRRCYTIIQAWKSEYIQIDSRVMKPDDVIPRNLASFNYISNYGPKEGTNNGDMATLSTLYLDCKHVDCSFMSRCSKCAEIRREWKRANGELIDV